MQQRKVLPRIINLAVFILLEIASLQVITHNAELQQTWMARAAQGFKGKREDYGMTYYAIPRYRIA